MSQSPHFSELSSQEEAERHEELPNMLQLLDGRTVDDYMSQKLDIKKSRTVRSGDDSDESSQEYTESDSNMEDEDDDDVDMEEPDATSPAEAGIITKITLKNFMCHDFFELELGPQLNFIIGRNGSGKSAILTGISVCLGAKASDTSRGSSIRELIKDGKEMARVSVVLKNQGSEAIEPELYGKKIIIERVLRRNGTNSYSIKSEKQRTVSTKKSTLDEILYKFNITVDNPMAFLSQDKAREFLTSTTDKVKFDYFIAGTLIENITEYYNKTASDINDVNRKIKQSKAQLRAIREKYKLSKIIYDRFRESDNLRKKLAVLNGKAHWFNVFVYENRIKGYEEDKQKTNEQIEALEKEINSIDDATSSSSLKISEMEIIVNDKAEETDRLKERLENSNENRQRVKAEGQQLESEIRKLISENSELKKSIHKHEAHIRQEEERHNTQGSSKKKLAGELAELNEEVELLGKQREKVRDQLTEMDSIEEHEELKRINDAIKLSKRELNNLKQRKANLERSQSDNYVPWGYEMKSVINKINTIGDWHQTPIGPIGFYVEVKNEYSEWKDLLNTVLSKSLDSFLVCDEHDRRLLQNIFKQFRVTKNIIIRKFEKFNFDHGKARSGTTFLDILNVQNDAVYYTLIDVNNIEKQIITKDRRSANRLVEQNNVMSVFSLLGKRSGNRASKADNGLFRLDPVHYRSELHKFSSASGSDYEIKTLDSQIHSEQENLNDLEQQRRQTMIQIQDDKQNLEKRFHLLSTQMNELSDKVFDIETKLNDSATVSQIEVLKAQIENETQQISTNEGIIISLRQEFDKVRQKSASLKHDLEDQKRVFLSSAHELERYRKELSSYTSDIDSLAERRDHLSHKRGALEEYIKATHEKIVRRQQELEPVLESARSKCSSDEANIDLNVDTIESISNEFEDTRRKIQQAEQAIGRSFEEVLQELVDNKSKKEAAENDHEDLEKTFEKLNDELRIRIDHLVTTVQRNNSEASISFERSLALRGFKGELRFSFVHRTLSLLAQTKNDEKKRSVESLSGGEKSFAQIALLLAIWKIMDSKIRGLDEFDVFMDSVNRSISIKLLLNELRQYPKSQSIFITPQDITMVGDLQSDDICIYKMRDPRREQ